MICRLAGRLATLRDESVVIDLGALAYEVLVPRCSAADLQRAVGREITLHTIQYFDGNPAVGQLVPRLVGFLTEADREFFNAFVKVKGLGVRKALRAMAVPPAQIALAIEQGDERALAGLPELGKRTATQIVAQLRGRMQDFAAPDQAVPQVSDEPDLTQAQAVALDILVHWGDRRADAQRWIQAAVSEAPELDEPDAIVRAAYRVKQSRPG